MKKINTVNYKIFDIFCNNKSTLSLSMVLLCSDTYTYKNQVRESKIISETLTKKGGTNIHINSDKIYLSISNKLFNSEEKVGDFTSMFISPSHVFTVQNCFESIIEHYSKSHNELFVFDKDGYIVGDKITQPSMRERHCEYNSRGGLFKVKIKALENKYLPSKSDLYFHLMSKKEDNGSGKNNGINVLLNESQFVILNRKLIEVYNNFETMKVNLLTMYTNIEGRREK